MIVGINEQGIELARRMGERSHNLRLIGFFDDRPYEDLNSPSKYQLIGKLQALPRFANENSIDIIYISLPMAQQPRIQTLLDGLRDTTASVYFVPNLFVTDLIQGRVDYVHGLPVVAVCETPFTGPNGVIKRIGDVLISVDPGPAVSAAAGHSAGRETQFTWSDYFPAAALRARRQGHRRL